MPRLYKETVKIRNYQGNFEKIVYVDRDGVFKTKIPVKNVKDDIISLSEIYDYDLKKLEEQFRLGVLEFESYHDNYEMVILYKLEELQSRQDGSGEGFSLNWCIAKKILSDEVALYDKYQVVRSAYNKAPLESWNKLKSWNQIRHSQQAEDFFMRLTENIRNLKNTLEQFIAMTSAEKEHLFLNSPEHIGSKIGR